MRFYAMGNYYLSSIQQGIQAAHALGEMVPRGIPEDNSPAAMFNDWVRNHKTMVLLNGGNSNDLNNLWQLLSDSRNTEFPISRFYEDHVSLGGALTCVAIVLPERLYDAEQVFPDDDFPAWDKELPVGQRLHRWFEKDTETMIEGWEAELLDVIKKLPLAK